jgi:hypothetical protein
VRRDRVTLYGLLRRDGEPRAAAAWAALCARLTGTHRALRAALQAEAVWDGQGVEEAWARLQGLYCPHSPQCTGARPCRVTDCATCGKPHYPRYCDLCGGHTCRDHECTWDDEDENSET